MDWLCYTACSLALAQGTYKGIDIYKYMMAKKLNKESTRLYQVLTEKDLEIRPNEYKNFWDSFYMIYNTHNRYENYLSFEIHADKSGISYYLWLSDRLQQQALNNINSIHKYAELQEADNDYLTNDNIYGKPVCCAELTLVRPFIKNILQVGGDKFHADPVTNICAGLNNLRDNEEITIQSIVLPIKRVWLDRMKYYYRNYLKTGVEPIVCRKEYYAVDNIVFLANVLKDFTLSASAKGNIIQPIGDMEKKFNESSIFDTTIRIITKSDDINRSSRLLANTVAPFATLSDNNLFKITRDYKPTKFIKKAIDREFDIGYTGNFLTSSELSSFLHYPNKNVPYVKRLQCKKLPIPDGIITYDTIEEAHKHGAIVFGYSDFRGDKKYLAFKDIRMLMQHLYTIGATGSGKTTLLQMLVLEVLKHAGVTFFDVKGDAILKLMRFIPKEHKHRINYIDLANDEYYMPFNVLKCGLDVYDTATLIVNVFVTVYGENNIQYHSQKVLRQAVIAVTATDPKGSILEVYRLFTDEEYLDKAINLLQKDGTYPDVLDYWKNVYKPMKPSGRRQEIGAILNKLQVITQNTRPRYTLCQQENVLDFRKLMDSRAINLVNLDIGKNVPEIQRFFGTLITALIRTATYSRSNIKEENNRIPHLFILDEFEKFTKQDEDFKDLLALARSYGLGMCISHQSTEQITKEMYALISDNTFTQIALNVGVDSAVKTVKMFPEFTQDDLTGLVFSQGVARLKKLSPNSFTFNTIDFTKVYQDNGEKYVDEIIRGCYNTKYRKIMDIKEEILKRYKTTEENMQNDDNFFTGAKKVTKSTNISRPEYGG